MPSPEDSSPIVKVLKKNNLAETQEKVFKIAIMNMSKDHKENMKKGLMKSVNTQLIKY